MIARFLPVFFTYFLVINFVVADETEEVISVASYIDSSELNASPVDIISSQEFKNLRVSTVAELSKYLSVASGSHFQTNALDGVDQGMSSITLRGLDHASTLILINKKRQTHSGTPSNEGEGYIDVNIIPEIALERIEILKDGATSLYGSDAVAGVINFNTYHAFDGSKARRCFLLKCCPRNGPGIAASSAAKIGRKAPHIPTPRNISLQISRIKRTGASFD